MAMHTPSPYARIAILGGASARPEDPAAPRRRRQRLPRATDVARLGPRDKRKDDGRWVGREDDGRSMRRSWGAAHAR